MYSQTGILGFYLCFHVPTVTKVQNELECVNVQQHCSLHPSVTPGTETGCVLLQSDSDDSIWGSKQQHHLLSSSTAVLTEEKHSKLEHRQELFENCRRLRLLIQVRCKQFLNTTGYSDGWCSFCVLLVKSMQK